MLDLIGDNLTEMIFYFLEYLCVLIPFIIVLLFSFLFSYKIFSIFSKFLNEPKTKN